MKKTFATTLVAATMVITMGMVGCGGSKQAAPEPAAQEQAATTETTTETTTQEQAAPAATAATEAPAAQETTAATSAEPAAQAPAPAPAATNQISADDAKAIAFQDAGVTEADVSLLDVHLDTDDGRTIYEVDFNVGMTEYDYDIDATNGAIIERSMDLDD